MNYIGSKLSLLDDIARVLDEEGVPNSGIALDLFTGTGTVAQFLKKRGYITYANDWQFYSYVTCVAYLEHNELPQFNSLINKLTLGKADTAANCVLSHLAALPGQKGSFYHAYCEGGKSSRLYFSTENGARIQAIRDQIELWSQEKLISPKERAWLIASLIEGADKVANTASVYGAYLKHIKRSAAKPLRLTTPLPVDSTHSPDLHRAFCSDSECLLDELNSTPITLVYIDPPYNARQYNSNYHVLETIARWDLDTIEPRGVTGLRTSGENRSPYCLKTKVLAGFQKLLSQITAEYVLFSYNNEGLVAKTDLEAIFNEHCDYVRFEEIPYKRFRADLDGKNRIYKGDSTMEYLILGRIKRDNK